MTIPVLTTKLYIPSVRENLILRPRLIERLNTGLGRKLPLGGWQQITRAGRYQGKCFGHPSLHIVAWMPDKILEANKYPPK